MRRASAVLGATMLALFASAASAQTKPDFSGTWTLDAEKTQAANPAPPAGGGGGGGGGGRGGMAGGMGGGAFGGGTLTLKVDATSFTTERQGPNGAITQVFKLDGTPTQISMGQISGTGKAKWDGDKLVVETTIQAPNGERTTKATYMMEGAWLVIANEQPGRDGQMTTRKQYYKKN